MAVVVSAMALMSSRRPMIGGIFLFRCIFCTRLSLHALIGLLALEIVDLMATH